MSVASTTSAKVPPAAHSEISAIVRGEDDDDDDNPRGVLVISGDLVDRCPALLAVQPAHAKGAVERMAWLGLLRSLSKCMEAGDLQQRHLVLRGPSRPQVIVKYIFTRVGMAEGRIDMTDTPGGSSCTDGECDPADMRVEIGLSTAPVATASAERL